MKIIDMKDEFIVADHVVAVRVDYKDLLVYTSNDFRYTFVFESEGHAKDCLRKLKSFLRSNNGMEDLFSVEEQPGYQDMLDERDAPRSRDMD